MEENANNSETPGLAETVEQEMLRKDEVALSDDPEGIAATMLGLYTPRFYELVQKLSQKELRKLIWSLVEDGIEDKPYNFTSKEGKEAFLIGRNLFSAKIMLVASQFDEILKKSQEQENQGEEIPSDSSNNQESPGNEDNNG